MCLAANTTGCSASEIKLFLKISFRLVNSEKTEYRVTPQQWPGYTQDVVEAFNEITSKRNNSAYFELVKEDIIKVNNKEALMDIANTISLECI